MTSVPQIRRNMARKLYLLLVLTLILAALPVSGVFAGTASAPASDAAASASARPLAALVSVTGCAKVGDTTNPLRYALLVAYNRNGREIARVTTGYNGCGTLRIEQSTYMYLQAYLNLGDCSIINPDYYNGYTGWFWSGNVSKRVSTYPGHLC